jgi:site-specific DNA-methyltransferase (adenine-specific)
MLEVNKIYCGDCLEVMTQIEDGTIDVILCDLPYGTTVLGWDSIIDLQELWSQYNRIIKRNGAIVLFCKQPFTSKLIMSNIENFKYCLVWEKTKGSNYANMLKQPSMVTEDIAVFSNGAIKYNTMTEPKEKRNIRNTKTDNIYKYKEGSHYFGTKATGKFNEFRTIPTDEKYTSNVLKYTVVGNNNKNRKHPTQKPVDLMERLLFHYSNENDIVLDNCIGSGTTAVACKNTNRRFIGIEQEQKYVDVTNERLNESISQTSLF